MATASPDARARALAPVVASGLVAQSVASTAARDALFLTHFPVTSLPYFVAVAALLSLPAAQSAGRQLARLGPARLVPWLLGANGVLFLVEWALLDALPRLASAVLYFHTAVLSGIAISAFWSLLNERFDPHSAKALLARVAGAATFGGLLGGVGAERVAALLSGRALLAVLALVGLFAAVASSAVAQGAPPGPERREDAKDDAPWTQIRRDPYLRDLAFVILLAAVLAALVDYALKVEAVAHFPRGRPLVQFFGFFYAATGLIAFVIQAALGRRALAWLGIAGTVAAHPAAVAVSSALGFFVPGPWRGVLPRGTDVCLRASFFRAGYQLLYTPLPEGTKRSAKPIIDVGWDSVGKGAGAAVVLALTRVPAVWAFAAVNAVALVAALVELVVARRLRAGYVHALEGGLVRGSQTLAEAAEYSLSDFTMVESLAGLDRDGLQKVLRAGGTEAGAPVPPADPVVAAIVELRSGDAARLRRALRTLPRDPLVVGALIPLLDRRDVLRDVVGALESFGARASAQLVDALLDPAAPEAVRRRIPAVLRSCASAVARDGLVEGLRLGGFELRLRCGRALLALTERSPALGMSREKALGAVELALAEGGDPALLREHLLNLLTLGLEREPASIAARALDTDDAHLRGTALEYYETVLPPALFKALEPHLAAAKAVVRPAAKPRSAGELRDELVKAGATMAMSLAEVRRRLEAAGETDS